MIDWTLPLKKSPIKDIDGDSYGPNVDLRAMLDDEGNYIPLSSRVVDRETERHFRQQFRQGVRFMVTAEREPSKPIYYKADGSPWMSHHARLLNRPGDPMSLHDRAQNAIAEIKRGTLAAESARELRQRGLENARRLVEEREAAAIAAQDAVESHPLWGTF